MSAWICPNDMIDLLTTAALYRRIEAGEAPSPEDMQATFDDLRQTNYDSVNYRYQESEAPEPYTFRLVHEIADMRPEHLLQVRHTIASYGYQSCEHTGWATSEAYKLIVNLGEWVDSKLDAAGWVRVGNNRGESEWLGESGAEWEWDRSKGFQTLDASPMRLAALRRAHAEYNRRA